MKIKVRLDTTTDIANFVYQVNKVKSRVFLIDDSGLRVNGKSFLGVCHAKEFANLWCECEEDIYTIIEPFVINE